jgi:hypothetical protein
MLKLSALDAAAKLLAETGEPMNCQDMIKGMSEKRYWTSPGGQTPHATLYRNCVGATFCVTLSFWALAWHGRGQLQHGRVDRYRVSSRQERV